MFFLFVVWLPVVVVLCHDIFIIYQGDGAIGFSHIGYLWQTYHSSSLDLFLEQISPDLVVIINKFLFFPASITFLAIALFCSVVYFIASAKGSNAMNNKNNKTAQAHRKWRQRFK